MKTILTSTLVIFLAACSGPAVNVAKDGSATSGDVAITTDISGCVTTSESCESTQGKKAEGKPNETSK